MCRFLVRISVLITSIYVVISYAIAQFYGIDIMSDWYVLLFELVIVSCSFSEGKYHCAHLRFLALSILIADSLCRIDNCYNFLTISKHNLSFLVIVALGFMASTISAVRHFLRVNKVKQMRKKSEHNNDNNERDKNVGNQDS
jgi:hypothetical protein